jgi:cytochrome c
LETGKNLIGPSLHGIIDRKAASIPGFTYSAAMKASGLAWSEDQLSKFLEHPQLAVPGTRMSFPGLADAKDRSDVIAYIKEKSK